MAVGNLAVLADVARGFSSAFSYRGNFFPVRKV